MTEWRGRARSILGQGVERLKDGALQWVTRISRDAAESRRSPEPSEPERRSRLERALGLLRFGVGVGRNGARRVRGRVSRTVRWASARIPGGLLSLSVVARPQGQASAPRPEAPGIRATAAPHGASEGSIRSGFFSGPDAARRPGRGDPSQLRAFGRDAWTLFALWEVRAELRPKHLSAPVLELRVRALGGAEVLRRQVELHGSLYLDGLVPGATYVVELWWTDGAGESPVAMPPASVTLAMGPPSADDQDSSVPFSTWASDDLHAPGPQRGPTLTQPASPPAWMRPGPRHPWAGSPAVSGASPTSAGGTRSGSGSGFSPAATSPGSTGSPASRTIGSGSGSGWSSAMTSPGGSWHQEGGGHGATAHSPTSPYGAWPDVGAIRAGEKRPHTGRTPAEVEALIRPARGPQPTSPTPPRSVSDVRQRATVPTAPPAPPSREGAGASVKPVAAKAERPVPRSQRGRKGRARRRRAQQDAKTQQNAGSAQASPGEPPRSEEPSVRRGFFQEAPSGPAGRRGRR